MIFLDNNSTTKLDKRVLESMLPYLEENFGNPHSNFHKYGRDAHLALEESREKISNIFEVDCENVVFTSGATESNNLFIKGAILKGIQQNTQRKKIFCSSIEHKCVLESFQFCKTYGFEIDYIPVNKQGLIDIDWLKNKTDDKTFLVSVMAVNNETGLRTNLEEINKICKEKGILFHSDMAQALLGQKYNFNKLNIDAVSISGHKIYGPKGIGTLIFNETPSNLILPITDGGLQEQDVRSGTMPVFLAVGLASALYIIDEEHDVIKKHLNDLKYFFIDEINKKTDQIKINSLCDDGHPGTINLHFLNNDADIMCSRLGKDLAISTVAACSGVDFEYSYVLKNMGFSEDIIKSSVRLCFGRNNTKAEALKASKLIVDNIF